MEYKIERRNGYTTTLLDGLLKQDGNFVFIVKDEDSGIKLEKHYHKLNVNLPRLGDNSRSRGWVTFQGFQLWDKRTKLSSPVFFDNGMIDYVKLKEWSTNEEVSTPDPRDPVPTNASNKLVPMNEDLWEKLKIRVAYEIAKSGGYSGPATRAIEGAFEAINIFAHNKTKTTEYWMSGESDIRGEDDSKRFIKRNELSKDLLIQMIQLTTKI